MTKAIRLRPIQTGEASYLTDHHNRPGEQLLLVTMYDGCHTAEHAEGALYDAAGFAGHKARDVDAVSLASVARWCADQWRLAQADMPAETDDDDSRYLDCHILATWEI